MTKENVVAEVERALELKFPNDGGEYIDEVYWMLFKGAKPIRKWLRALLARVRELEAAHRGDISLLEMVNADLDALREQLTTATELLRTGADAVNPGWTDASRRWVASQKGTP